MGNPMPREPSGAHPLIGNIATRRRAPSAAGADAAVGCCDKIRDVTDSLLRELVDNELASVVFVMDYLQLDFGEARFTCYVWPTVAIGDVALQYGDPGYRDALCAFIAHKVTSTEESSEAGLAIRFDLGEIVTNPNQQT